MIQSVKNSLIFVVEDNTMFLRLIKFQLQNKGYENIKLFSNGTECVNNINQNPDIVILDYSLGDMTGLDVLKKIRDKSPKSKVIMLSEQKSIETTVKILKLGVNEYIVKNNYLALKKLTRTIRYLLLKKLLRKKRKIFNITISVFFVLVLILATFFYFGPKIFG